MRDTVDICLRTLAQYPVGRWSTEMETFWREVELKYKACNVMQIPQQHIPLWWERAKDLKIPLAAPSPQTTAPAGKGKPQPASV